MTPDEEKKIILDTFVEMLRKNEDYVYSAMFGLEMISMMDEPAKKFGEEMKAALESKGIKFPFPR